jgi:hypothetical protein
VGIYIVLALRRHRIDELVLAEIVIAGALVLEGVLHEGGTRELGQLRLFGGAQQHLAHLVLDGRHGAQREGSQLCGGAIGPESRRIVR